MQRSFAVLALLLAGASLGTVFPRGDSLPAVVLVTAVVFAGFLGITAVRAWRVRLGVLDSAAAATLSTVNALTYLLPTEQVLPMATRSNAMVIATLLAAGFQRPRHAVMSCLALMAVYFATAVGVDGVAGAVEGLWPLLAAPLAGGVVSRVLRLAASRADQAHVVLRTARVLEAKAAAQRAAHKQFQRTLHDDVAAALRAAGTPDLDPDTVRHACLDALNRAEAAPVAPSHEVVDLRAGLDLLPAPPGVRLHRARGPAVPAPADVVRTVLDAAGEALVNVGRHAKASEVSVVLAGDREGFTVRISDDGVGFRPTAVRRTSMGLRDSVFGRLADIGGSADVRTAPGRGTTVELRWTPADPGEEPAAESARLQGLRAAVDDIRQPLAAVCVPYLLSMMLSVVIHLGAAPVMGWLAAWYAVLASATVLLILRARRPLGTGVGLLAAVWTAGGAVVAMLVLPADSLTTFVSWPIGAIGPMLVVLATLWWWPLAVATLLVEELVLVVLVATGGFVTQSFADVLPAMTAPLLALAMGLVIANTIARLGGVVLAAGAEQTEIAVSTAARDARLAVHARRIAEIGTEIVPFLRVLAATDAETLGSAQTRTRARRLEWMARDELHIPGVLDTGLRQRLMSARTAGCTVTVQADTDTVQPPEAVRSVLDAALRTTPLPRELTLSLSGKDEQVLISLVCQPNDDARAAALRAELPGARVTEYDTEAIGVELLVAAEAGPLS